jgi:hypothetical protein
MGERGPEADGASAAVGERLARDRKELSESPVNRPGQLSPRVGEWLRTKGTREYLRRPSHRIIANDVLPNRNPLLCHFLLGDD